MRWPGRDEVVGVDEVVEMEGTAMGFAIFASIFHFFGTFEPYGFPVASSYLPKGMERFRQAKPISAAFRYVVNVRRDTSRYGFELHLVIRRKGDRFLIKPNLHHENPSPQRLQSLSSQVIGWAGATRLRHVRTESSPRSSAR